MTAIRIINPLGAIPAQQPRQLVENQAQSAINLKLGNHEARPLDGPTTIETPYHGTDTLTIHRYPDLTGALGAPAATAAAVGSNIRHNALSPDGKWMAVALAATPFIAIYAVADAALTAPTSPTGGDIPAGVGNWVAWSPDGLYVFLAHDTTPFVSAWPWDGTWGTKVVPGTPPAAAGLGVAVSPDGGYVAVAHATTPYLSIYPFTSAFDTQVVPTGKDIPAGAGNGVAWSLDSRWVLLAHTATPYVSAWRWTGELGDKRSPGSSMLATGNGTHIAVSSGNRWVAIVQTGAPYTRVWRFDTAQGDPFRYLVTDPGTALSSQAQAVSWDSRGAFIFYGVGSSPFLEAYAWGYGAFGRKLTATAAAAVRGLAFSSDDQWAYLSYLSTTGLAASDRSSTSWLNWNRRVNCVPGPVANDYRNRRYFTGDGPPKKTGNDIAIPGTGSPAQLPADWLHMGVKAPAAPTTDNLGDPLTNAVPAGNGLNIAWSPNGRYVAVAHGTSPFLSVWDMLDPQNPVQFANPGTLPPSTGISAAWSPDGEFVGVAHFSTPFVSVYPWSAAGFGAKVANPATLPPDSGISIVWSPAGDFVGVAHVTTPYVSIYPWSAAGFGAKVANPAALPTGNGAGIAWSPGGDFVGVAHNGSPFVSVYPWSAAGFGAKVANPATLPAGVPNSIVWSPAGDFVGVAHSTTPFVSIYPWSAATRTVERKETRPVYRSVPIYGGEAGEISGYTQEQIGTEEITVIDTISLGFGGVLVPATPPTGNGAGIAWSPGGAYVGVAHTTTPNLSIYPWASRKTTRSYVVTYVTGWGEEGAPCPPVEYEEEHFILPRLVFPGEGLGRYNITHRRIYRLAVGSTGAAFLLAGEQIIAETEFSDQVPDGNLGAALRTANFAEPPSDLRGLAVGQGGTLVAISGKQVCFSEPFYPYAWPYRYTLAHTPVALAVVGSTVVVATEGHPVLMDGTHPGRMAQSPIENSQACVSAESLVEVRGGVIYASPDGLFYVSPGRSENVTRKLLSKDDWENLNPSTMVGAVYDGRGYLLYDSGAGVYKALVLDPQDLEKGLLTNQAASGSLGTVAFSDLDSDLLYFVIGGIIKSWDTDNASPLTSTWKSKKFPALRPVSPSVLQVRASFPGTVTVKVYGDGALKATLTITSTTPVRLPGGFLAEEWELQAESTIAWSEITMATSMGELKMLP